MILWRFVRYTTEESSQGFSWHLSKKDAEAARAEFERNYPQAEHDSSVERVTIRVTKDGVLDALVRYASHPDNG